MCTSLTSTLDNPCNEIRIGEARGKRSQRWIESRVTWKWQATVIYDHNRGIWTRRHFLWSWNDVRLRDRRLDVIKNAASTAEFPRVREVAIVTQLFWWDPGIVWKVCVLTCIRSCARENPTEIPSTFSSWLVLHWVSRSMRPLMSRVGSLVSYELSR